MTIQWIAILAVVAAPMPAALAVDVSSGYQAIQRAFLREDFATVAALAPDFLEQTPQGTETSKVWLWLVLSLDRLHEAPQALQRLDQLKGRLETSDPLWPEALFWEGEISRRARQMLRAKLAYQRLLEHYPDSTWASQAQMGLGLIYVEQQAFESAVGHLHEVALRRPDTQIAFDALLLEGLCHLRLGRFGEAQAIFEPLLQHLQEPQALTQTEFYLGESLSGLKRYEDAVHAYQRAVASVKPSRWSHLAQFGLGWSLYQVSRCDESIEAFETYLAMEALAAPADHRVEALFAQGSCFLRTGRERQALVRFEEIVERFPAHPLAFESGLAAADAYRQRERFDTARELLHQILRWPLAPNARAQINLRLGAIALAQGNAAQAKTVFELARQSTDLDVRQAAWNGLGDVQLVLGDLISARRFYDRAVQVAPRAVAAAYATYQMGRIYLQSGAPEQAIALFETLARDPHSRLKDDARLALALVSINRGDAPAARSFLDPLRREQPNSILAARGAYYLALLALSDGEAAAAERFCQETIVGAPRSDEAIDARLLIADLLAERSSPQEAMDWLWDEYLKPGLSHAQRAKLAKRLADFSRADQSYADAIRWYDEAARLLPALGGETMYRTASCYEEAGDLGLAMQWYQRITQPPWRVRGQLALAKLLERQDRVQEAEAIYERLAMEPIPEAQVVQERLAQLRAAATDEER